MLGEASTHSLVNLAEGGVITLDWVENYVKKKSEEQSEKMDKLVIFLLVNFRIR